MKIMTDYMGEVEYSENDVIAFEDGLYGFEDNKRFMIIRNSEAEHPFSYLQSLDDENLSFVVTDPFQFVDSYEFDLPDTVVESLGIREAEDVIVQNIVVIPDSVRDTTINLAAPIIINLKASKAKQVIINEVYPCRHKIFENN
jgi:flagellar assembly factor FliW